MSKANGNGTALAPVPPRKDFLAKLDDARGEIARLLPDPAKVDRVVRIVRTAYMMNADLRDCTPESLIASVMKACELNLEPGGALKHAWLVPFKRVCTFQLSYTGMLELARRSGEYRAVEARLVRRGDRFRLAYTPEPVFEHVPNLEEDGPITHAYAYARLASGSLVLEVMSTAEVEHVRQSAKCGPVWANHWGEMAKKTVIKRLLKRQPCSVAMAEAIEHDNEVAGIEGIARGARAFPPGLSRADQMAAALEPPEEPAFAEGTAGTIRTEADPEFADDPEGDELEPGSRG